MKARRVAVRMVVVVAVFFLLPEAVVRTIAPALGAYTAIRFGNDPRSAELFVRDHRLHWALRPDADLEFMGARVRTDEHGFRRGSARATGRLVLSLGDSTTFGWGVADEETYSAQLEERLAARNASSESWRVVNAGVPGYSSYQVRLVAERLIPELRPDVVVVCVGNNDPAPQALSDREIDEGRRVARAVTWLLSRSDYLTWLSELARPRRDARYRAESLMTAVPRVPLEETGRNLEAIVATARQSGAAVVVVTPPVNLFSMPLRAGELADWPEVKRRADEASRRLGAGDLRGATTLYRGLLADYPEDSRVLWLNGLLDARYLGRPAAGIERLELAFERHPFPSRARRSHRRIARDVAAAAGASVVDANDVLRAAAGPAGLAAWEALYIDHCHPTPRGHVVLAEALAALWPTEPTANGSNA